MLSGKAEMIGYAYDRIIALNNAIEIIARAYLLIDREGVDKEALIESVENFKLNNLFDCIKEGELDDPNRVREDPLYLLINNIMFHMRDVINGAKKETDLDTVSDEFIDLCRDMIAESKEYIEEALRNT